MATAFLFPGQGSQVVGMGKDFYANFKESRLVYEEASDEIHVDLKQLCFEGPAEDLTATENLQPCLFTTSAAILAALKANTPVAAEVFAGHSLGEYSALHACGSLAVGDGARLTRARGAAMQEAVPPGTGTMAAVLGLEAPVVAALCDAAMAGHPDDPVEPANYNAPGQIAVAGTVTGVGRLAGLIRENPEHKRARVVPLAVSAPFHCSLMAPAGKKLAPLLADASFAPFSGTLISNVTARPTRAELEVPGLLTAQVTQPVRWEESMRALSALEVGRAYEIGPGKVLAGLLKRINPDIHVRNIATVAQMKEAFG